MAWFKGEGTSGSQTHHPGSFLSRHYPLDLFICDKLIKIEITYVFLVKKGTWNMVVLHQQVDKKVFFLFHIYIRHTQKLYGNRYRHINMNYI